MRRYVKAVLRQCVICKKVDGTPYSKPIPAPLPTFRVQRSEPFSSIGIDYTGHLFVKDPINQAIVKVYICLFTCTITRAIHLELVRDLTTESFLLALRRFTSRRSTPNLIISDNASTFVSASHQLKEIIQNSTVQRYLSDQRIAWKFTPKRSPWCGGFFERMISITKTSLKKVLGRSCVTYVELETILTEIESSINERPLTFVSSDIADLNPLTPSHLINGRSIHSLPQATETVTNPNILMNHHIANHRYRYLTMLQDAFWRRWSHEYITALRERHINQHKGVKTNRIKVGDIVLVHDDIKKRLHWNLACVTKLLPGSDGIVRAAEIKTKSGMTNRDISRLYPLEISTDNTQSDQEISTDISATSLIDSQPINDEVDNSNTTQIHRQSRRKAAQLAKQRITMQYNDNSV
ncbi:uncharacterized protein LOC102809591 [Saccoglossus kowalevskii]|uniref:Uncharacterized protein LOC102809591 n=1 Tax=Saccoglossus kowalevskii TaxID=10224 RepID=A0ABM0M358_SACKO|nr:PREDICTED: uncharacterized protein LOC102809591 [Saccoglossus kowalevskii]